MLLLKRMILALILLPLALLLALWWFADISPRQLAPATALATGMGAKLACSSRYLSGFDAQRVSDDLASYSALTRLLSYRDLPEHAVQARLLFSPPSVARYRPGLGCTLEYAGYDGLDALRVPPLAPPPQLPWPAGAAPAVPEPSLQRQLEEMLAADNRAGLDTRALLVAVDGRVAAAAYAPGIDRDTPLLGWSMGKSIVAILLGRLEALGALQRDEQDLFPAWSADARVGISVENLLQMSSGLAFDEEYVPGSDSTRMLFSAPSAADVAMASPLQHPPGSYFSYSSGTTNLLARLAFERLGADPQALVDFFHRELALPMGLETMVLEPDASGVPVGSSYVYASARDWARFGQLLLDGGRSNGRRLLDAAWVTAASRPNASANDPRYGYQLWLNAGGERRWPSLPDDAYAMLGNREQVVMIVPSARAVLVRLGWSDRAYPVDDNFARILDAL